MIERIFITINLWRDPHLRHTLRSAWRTAGHLIRETSC
jgi:hypothetical protein